MLRWVGALRQLEDAGLGDGGNHREVKVLQPLLIGKLGLLEIAAQLVVMALRHHLGQQRLEIAEVACALLLGFLRQRHTVPRDRGETQLLEIPLDQRKLRVGDVTHRARARRARWPNWGWKLSVRSSPLTAFHSFSARRIRRVRLA